MALFTEPAGKFDISIWVFVWTPVGLIGLAAPLVSLANAAHCPFAGRDTPRSREHNPGQRWIM
jgi:hypothetical protein